VQTSSAGTRARDCVHARLMNAVRRVIVTAGLIDVIAGERSSLTRHRHRDVEVHGDHHTRHKLTAIEVHGDHRMTLADRGKLADAKVEKEGYGSYSYIKYTIKEIDNETNAAIAALEHTEVAGPLRLKPLFHVVAAKVLKNIVFCKQNGHQEVGQYYSALYAHILEMGKALIKPYADARVDKSETGKDALNFEGQPNSNVECEAILEELQQSQKDSKPIDHPPIWEDWHMLMEMYLENVIAANGKSRAFQLQYYADRLYKTMSLQSAVVQKFADVDMTK